MIQDSVRDEMDTEDGTTPRPWDFDEWLGRMMVSFADARLIVVAVNDYDRLREVEAAAKATGWNEAEGRCWCHESRETTGKPDHDPRCARLRAALTPEADAPSERTELEETGR